MNRPWKLQPMEQFKQWLDHVGFADQTAMVVFDQWKPFLIHQEDDTTKVRGLEKDQQRISQWEKDNNRNWGKSKAKPLDERQKPEYDEKKPNAAWDFLTAQGEWAKTGQGTLLKMGHPIQDEQNNFSMGNEGFKWFSLIWAELDDGSFLEQYRLIRRTLRPLGIDPTLVSSGSKSVHVYIPLDAPHPFKEVEALLEMLVVMVGGDPTVATQHRQMRPPGFPRNRRISKDLNAEGVEEFDVIEKWQRLLHIGDPARPLAEVKAAFDRWFDERGMVYSQARFSSYVVAKQYKKLGRELPTKTDQDPHYFLGKDNPEEKFGGSLRGQYKQEEGSDRRPSAYRDESTVDGRKVKALERLLIDEYGMPGVFEMFERDLLADDNNFPGFEFQKLDDGIWAGYNPFSEHNSSGNSFRVWLDGGWFDWNNRLGGKLADFLIWIAPGVENPGDPSGGEVDQLIRFMQRFAGITDTQLEEEAKKIQGETDIEEVIQAVAAIMGEEDAAAVPIKQAKFRANHGVSYEVGLNAFRARQDAIYSEQSTFKLGDLLKREQKAEDWIIPGRLQRGAIVSFVGKYGLGKTTAVEGLLINLARGREIEPGRPPARPMRILYLQAELTSTQHQNLLQDAGWLERYEEGVMNNITTRYGWTWGDKAWLFRELERAAEADNPYDLIVIDSVSGALQGRGIDENSLQFSQETYGTLLDVKNRTGVGALVIAHPNAEGTKHRGHTSAPAKVDHIWWLEGVSAEDFTKARQNINFDLAGGAQTAADFLQIRVEKHRGGMHTGPMLVRIDYENRTIKNFGAMYQGGAKAVQQGSIEQFLTKQQKPTAYSSAYLNGITGGNQDTTRKTLKRLQDSGIIEKVQNPEDLRGAYWRMIRWQGSKSFGFKDEEKKTTKQRSSPRAKAAKAAEAVAPVLAAPAESAEPLAPKVERPEVSIDRLLMDWTPDQQLEKDTPIAVNGGGVWRNGYRLAEQKPDSLKLRFELRPGQWVIRTMVADCCKPVREAG